MDQKAKNIFLHQLQGKKYLDGITLITPSGERPECIKQCHFYIERQTYSGPLQWILADDSKEHYQIGCPKNVQTFTHLKRTYPGNKSDSFRSNVIVSLAEIIYNKLIIIEDDDWYSPDYVKLYHDRLLSYELIGEGPARYYAIPTQTFRILGNTKRASFCQTALRSSIIDKLFIACQRDSAFVDARLWNKHVNRKIIFQDKCHCVGIKGMIGRKGIGIGHRLKNGSKDSEWKTLINWIGKEDVEFYKQIHQKYFNNNHFQVQ